MTKNFVFFFYYVAGKSTTLIQHLYDTRCQGKHQLFLYLRFLPLGTLQLVIILSRVFILFNNRS